MERISNKLMLDKIGSVLMLRKSMAVSKTRFFGHIVRNNSMEKRLIEGRWKASGKGADLQRPRSRI